MKRSFGVPSLQGAGVAFTALSRARDALLNLGGIGDEFAAAYEGCSAEELAKLLPRQALSVQTPEELHRTVHVWLTLLEHSGAFAEGVSRSLALSLYDLGSACRVCVLKLHSDAPDSMRFHSRDLDLARERDGILESEEESAAGGEPAAAKSAPAVSAFAEKLQEELRLLKDLRLPPELLGLHFGFAEVRLERRPVCLLRARLAATRSCSGFCIRRGFASPGLDLSSVRWSA